MIMAQSPHAYLSNTDQFIQLMTTTFPESTQQPTQVAWTLSAAGVAALEACPSLGNYYRGRLQPSEFLVATLGAFPIPSVQRVVIGLQADGVSAQAAAAQLKQANAQYDSHPLQLGVLLRVNFSDTAGTPIEVAQALKNAGYTSKQDVQSALQLLFPQVAAGVVAAAVNQVFG